MAYSMARRNDLSSVLTRFHSKFLTPYYAILGSGILMAVLVLFVDLTKVVAVNTLLYFLLTQSLTFRLSSLKRTMNATMFCPFLV